MLSEVFQSKPQVGSRSQLSAPWVTCSRGGRARSPGAGARRTGPRHSRHPTFTPPAHSDVTRGRHHPVRAVARGCSPAPAVESGAGLYTTCIAKIGGRRRRGQVALPLVTARTGGDQWLTSGPPLHFCRQLAQRLPLLCFAAIMDSRQHSTKERLRRSRPMIGFVSYYM